MGEQIFVQDREGQLDSLEEERFATEEELQELLATHPELLDGVQINPDAPRRWMVIGREQGIAQAAGEGDWWSVDHLLVDQDAIPTLVEVKRGSNPEIRRTVVGQLLEYAAHARLSWSADGMRRAFENTAQASQQSPQEILGGLLQSDSEPDADAFWRMVATNLDAVRLRLLIVADDIPAPLRQVAEFLDSQMPNVEVRTVEIKRYRNRSMQILVPRVFGGGARGSRSASLPTPRLTREVFLDGFDDEATRDAAIRLLDIAEDKGMVIWQQTSVVIKARCSWRPFSIAWLYPPSPGGSRLVRNQGLHVWRSRYGILSGLGPGPARRVVGMDGTVPHGRLCEGSRDQEHHRLVGWLRGCGGEHRFAFGPAGECPGEAVQPMRPWGGPQSQAGCSDRTLVQRPDPPCTRVPIRQ